MTTSLLCLMLFALWTLCLVILGIGGYRVFAVLMLKKSANAFPADQTHEGPKWYKRCQRAHLNCVENLPIFACAVLMATVLKFSSSTFDLLAQIYLGARVLQSITHIMSTSIFAVNVRFAFFLTQLICVITMFWLIYSH